MLELCLGAGFDCVIPLAMKFRWNEINRREFIVGNLAAFLIPIWIEPGVDLQSGCGLGRADQIDNDFVAFERLASPVSCHVAEKAVFDLVPFAGARGEMAYLDFQAQLVAQFLQFSFPESTSAAVASSAVGRDQEPFRFRIGTMPQPFPPATDRFNCKLCSVTTDSHTDPGLVATNVVTP